MVVTPFTLCSLCTLHPIDIVHLYFFSLHHLSGICGYAALASVEALASSTPLTTFALPPYLALLLSAATVSATVAFADSYEKAQLAAAVASAPSSSSTSSY